MKKPHLTLVGATQKPPPKAFAPGPWTQDPGYRGLLVAEAFGLRAGDNITPNAHHVCAMVDMLLDLAAKSDRLADLAEQMLAERGRSQVARWLKKRCNVLGNGRYAPNTTRHSMAVNFPAVSQIITLFVDAFNDSANAFGKKQGISSISGFANLLPDVMGLVSSVGDLKAEFDAIKSSDIAGLVSEVEGKLSIPSAKAEAVVNDVLQAIVAILNSVTSASTDVEAAMLKHTK